MYERWLKKEASDNVENETPDQTHLDHRAFTVGIIRCNCVHTANGGRPQLSLGAMADDDENVLSKMLVVMINVIALVKS